MSLGQRLKKARKRAKLRQEDVAEKLGLHFSTISKWESDDSKPDLDTFVKLAQMYRVDFAVLLGGEPNNVRFDDIHPELAEALKDATPEQRQLVVDYLAGRVDSPVEYTDAERRILEDIDRDLTPEDLTERYNLKIGERPATKEEIQEAIAFIRVKRAMKAME